MQHTNSSPEPTQVAYGFRARLWMLIFGLTIAATSVESGKPVEAGIACTARAEANCP